MNLRLPVVAGIVAIAAATAGLRACHGPSAAPPPFTSATSEPPWRSSGAAAAGAFGARRSRPHSTPPGIVVYVAGAVVKSGLYTLPATARGADALRAAGGATADADLVAVNLAARLGDGDEVAVPVRGAPVRRAGRPRSGTGSPRSAHRRTNRHRRTRHARNISDASSGPATDEAPAPSELIDLNTADVDQLQTLPGIGPALAERIVTVRDQSGPFASPDDLLDVGGMTQSKVDAIAPYVVLR